MNGKKTWNVWSRMDLSLLALILLCTYPHPSDQSSGVLLTGGQICRRDTDCYSGLCYTTGCCAPDGPVRDTAAGGAICQDDTDCFSNYCIDFVCAPDSPAKGKVAAGGMCERPEQCYSGNCYNRRCAPDSILIGKVAAGGKCGGEPDQHDICYSGYCHLGRCGPDGATAGRVPGGGYCNHDHQCYSNVCVQGRCSVDSRNVRGKVADGGRCFSHNSCESGVCYEKICTRPAEKGVNYAHGYPGGVCRSNENCHVFAECIEGRCAPPSRWHVKTVADGGMCIDHEDCQSGNCHDNYCSVSHYDRHIFSSIAAGASCEGRRHEDCWSGLCTEGRCSAESLWAPETEALKRLRRMVAAGGRCKFDDDCYSGYCDNAICGPNGPTKGTVASGGQCVEDRHCFSGHCYERRCVATADVEGQVAPGGRCNNNQTTCGRGSVCNNYQYCVIGRGANVRPAFQSVDLGEACWSNAQCTVGRCVDSECSVPWFAMLANNGGGGRSGGGDVPIACLMALCAILGVVNLLRS